MENLEEIFDEFWKRYPKKKGKKKARVAFAKAAKIPGALGKMLDALEVHKNTKQWQKEEGQFIPYPATWLNGESWDDDIEPHEMISVVDGLEFEDAY